MRANALLSASQETLQFVVPTGAGGHITGGIIAQKMGLPVALCAATNENDIVHRLFAKGDLSLASEVGVRPGLLDMRENGQGVPASPTF